MLRIRPYRSIDNVIDGVVLIFVDITGRRRAGAASEQVSRIIEEGFDETYILDADTLRFSSVSRRAREHLGYSMDELRRLMPSDIEPEGASSGYRTQIDELTTGKADHRLTFKATHRRKDGSIYPVEARLVRIEDPPLIVINVIDRTPRDAS
jgi:PAS domain S-box-containing protein